MPPTFVLADLYCQDSPSRTAYSARPHAPIQPAVPRWQRLRSLTTSLPRRLAPSTRPAPHLEHTPAHHYS